MATFVQGKFDYTADFRQSNFEFYGQDEWRFRPNLTLYYGVRYSRFGQPVDANGRLTNFDPRLFNPANAPQVTGAGNRVAGTGNFCNGMIVNSQNPQTAVNCTPGLSPFGEEIVKTPKRDFAPRVGLDLGPVRARADLGAHRLRHLPRAGLDGSASRSSASTRRQENFTISNTRLDNPCGNRDRPALGAASTLRAIQSDGHTPTCSPGRSTWQHQLPDATVMNRRYFARRARTS